ncbi:MAG: hypothetical protein JNL23_09105 [Chitinophagaceae bacterium]|nr:hypothetical protein [Chitinophagaceae bacterium]
MLFLISFIILFTQNSYGQLLPSDSGIYLSSKENLTRLYVDSIGENLRLYNGTQFTTAYKSNLGHPFFEDANPQAGTIFYGGTSYSGTKLLYDIIRDEVICVNKFKNDEIIKLIPSKINWFTLQQHLFVHLLKDSNDTNFPGNGFYEQLYNGNMAVFKKVKKQFFESSKTDEPSKYIQYNYYYIRKKNKYHLIDNRRSLIAVCDDRKADVANFIRKERLNFKKDAATMIVRVIDYYESSKN